MMRPMIRPMLRRIILIVLALAVALPIAGCGRRGALEAPEDSRYPREYPSR